MLPDYDEIDRLIDTDPIALGERCRRAEALLTEVFAAETWDEIKAIQRRGSMSSSGEGSK